MISALIGHTGFVGRNLRRQADFDHLYNSANFRDLTGRDFDLIICAGLPAAKWLANKDPEKDRANMIALADTLSRVRARRFVLISTVDVYPTTAELDEDFEFHAVADHHPYGVHRREFENHVRRRFERTHILRLPGLFGDGLKKNVIFDLLHDHAVAAIDPASVFQWYWIGRLWTHVELSVEAGLKLVNLVTEPIPTRDIVGRFFPNAPVGGPAGTAVAYDLRTKHGALFGSQASGYVQSRAQVMADLSTWLSHTRDGTGA